jgi:hypothetical protein
VKNTSIKSCQLIELPKIHNRAGNITAINGLAEVPFNIQRVYYLYDIPGGAERGGHAHKELQQLIVAAGGSFDVHLHDGLHRKVIHLNRPYFGLLIVPGIWRELHNFSSGSTCLVLASNHYDENDYIRVFNDFKKLKLHA